MKKNLSIIIPVLNEEGSLSSLIQRIRQSLVDINYELIFIDDHSTDTTVTLLKELAKNVPISIHEKQGKKGKAQSLLEGFTYARYENLCMIDADLQYPPEVIPQMLERIESGETDIVVADRKEQHIPINRRFVSGMYKFFFGKLLHGFDCDVQSGLKVFLREIIERFSLDPSPWTFDLEFLIKARDAGYKIENQDIVFAKREGGKPKIDITRASFEIGWSALKLKCQSSQVIPFHQSIITEKGHGFHYKGKEYIHHSELPIKETAFFRIDTNQKIIFLELITIFILCTLLNWHETILISLAGLTGLYFIDFFFILYPIVNSYVHPAEIHISQKDLELTKDKDWPRYTILCPLYKEWRVLPQFVDAMSKLQYPKNKLQVMLLLEEDDNETVSHMSDFKLPKYFQIVVVPNSKPKTKPKACNYGLRMTKGEYVVIYDAEDIPDPLQLKKTVLAFERAEKNTVCVQAKLNFYNPHQNPLTRAFSAEYSLWFDLVLPGLQSIHAPIPLGGTSNHFNTKAIKLLKGWDSFNVTEDADLGTRLFKEGYQTVIVDSETLEEANSHLGNWFTQRGRWIQGYIQTYLVHMRKPREFLTNERKHHIITYQFIILGKVLSMFVNLFMWAITLTYFLFRPEVGKFIESFFPAPILYMAVFCFVAGNFLYMYYYMIGCMKHGHYELVKYIIFVPIYWLMMSFAAWRAVYKFIVAPHYWAKTKHGLHLDNKRTLNQASGILGYDLVPIPVTDNGIS